MAAEYLVFKRYNNKELAAEMGEYLKEQGIDYTLEDTGKYFDPSFAGNSFGSNINLKIKGEDFVPAQKLLEKYYAQELEEVGKDYYLFSFTDAELVDIISKPDEWGAFDYMLAQNLLSQRGKTIAPETLEQLQERRRKELSRPEKNTSIIIEMGYILAFAGGVPGVILGYNLMHSRKTLPNGERVLTYSDADRKHGKNILRLGLVITVIAILFIVYNIYLTDYYKKYSIFLHI